MSAGGGPAFERYRCQSQDEWLMRIGAAEAPSILFVPPLFEEMNRTRALIAATMRLLAGRGFGCWLPDLPGTGESERALEETGWEDWRAGVMTSAAHVAQRSGRPPLVASLRGGALLDNAAHAQGWWRFAPVAGTSLARDLDRAALAGGGEWAGYPAPPAMREALAAAQPSPVTPLRTVSLASAAGAADAKLLGPALWRRSEPGNSAELAQRLALDIEEWSRACGGC